MLAYPQGYICEPADLVLDLKKPSLKPAPPPPYEEALLSFHLGSGPV